MGVINFFQWPCIEVKATEGWAVQVCICKACQESSCVTSCDINNTPHIPLCNRYDLGMRFHFKFSMFPEPFHTSELHKEGILLLPEAKVNVDNTYRGGR